jgi:hypothetical protein
LLAVHCAQAAQQGSVSDRGPGLKPTPQLLKLGLLNSCFDSLSRGQSSSEACLVIISTARQQQQQLRDARVTHAVERGSSHHTAVNALFRAHKAGLSLHHQQQLYRPMQHVARMLSQTRTNSFLRSPTTVHAFSRRSRGTVARRAVSTSASMQQQQAGVQQEQQQERADGLGRPLLSVAPM